MNHVAVILDAGIVKSFGCMPGAARV